VFCEKGIYGRLVSLDAPAQRAGVGLGSYRQLRQQVAHGLLFQIALVEQFEGALTRASPAAQAEQV